MRVGEAIKNTSRGGRVPVVGPRTVAGRGVEVAGGVRDATVAVAEVGCWVPDKGGIAGTSGEVGRGSIRVLVRSAVDDASGSVVLPQPAVGAKTGGG